MARNLVTSSTTRSAARSTSARVVGRPRLKRTEAAARAGATPIARSTYDGSGCAEVQAEPELTARSVSEANRALPSMSAKLRLLVPGRH